MLKQIRLVSLFLILTVDCAVAADGTALGELAESMAPGTWAELSTNGLNVMDAPTSSGSSGHILPFANEFMWDATTKKAFFIGGDHDGGPEKFVEYDALTNTWKENPRPAWMNPGENQNHSYSYMGMDPRGRFWYEDNEYDTANETWVVHGKAGQHYSSATRARKAYGYLPGLGNVLYFEGAVYIWDEDGNGPWRQIEPRFALGCNECAVSNVAVENRVTNKILFGGSDASDQLYLIDTEENIQTLGPTPLSQISMNGEYTSTITVDPGTGYFILLSPSGQLWEFDSENDRWTLISESTPLSTQPATNTSWQNNIIGATCMTHSVSIYVRWILGAEPKMWLYKHSLAVPQVRPGEPADLTAQ